MSDLKEGDMVRHTRSEKVGTFLFMCNTKRPRAKVCWIEVDIALMRASAREVSLDFIEATGERHPAYVLWDKLKGGA